MTTTEALAEKDEPKESTTTTEASAEAAVCLRAQVIDKGNGGIGGGRWAGGLGNNERGVGGEQEIDDASEVFIRGQ